MNGSNTHAAATGSEWRNFQNGRLLLASLIVLQVGMPLLPEGDRYTNVTLGLTLYLLVLATAVLELSGTRSKRLASLALTIPVVVAGVVAMADPRPHAVLLIATSMVPLVGFTALCVLRHVLRPGLVAEHRLIGTGSVFLLIAHFWAGLYAGVELLDNGSFNGIDPTSEDGGSLLYFSLVTQTTLGYGDITPKSPLAQSLATLQAVVGLFYMGVIVARFVGGFTVGENKEI